MKKALEDNYLCRSAYKLIEMDDRFHFLQPGRVVIDCGASPGNFLITVQVTLLLKKNLMIINITCNHRCISSGCFFLSLRAREATTGKMSAVTG